MATIQSVPELYTDEIVDLGSAAREIKFHMRVIEIGGDPAGVWHYYGTEVPQEYPNAVQHPAVHFPLDFFNLPSGAGLLFDLAFDVAINILNT